MSESPESLAAKINDLSRKLAEAEARISDLESRLLMEEQIRADAEARLAAAENGKRELMEEYVWRESIRNGDLLCRIAALEAECRRRKAETDRQYAHGVKLEAATMEATKEAEVLRKRNMELEAALAKAEGVRCKGCEVRAENARLRLAARTRGGKTRAPKHEIDLRTGWDDEALLRRCLSGLYLHRLHTGRPAVSVLPVLRQLRRARQSAHYEDLLRLRGLACRLTQ